VIWSKKSQFRRGRGGKGVHFQALLDNMSVANVWDFGLKKIYQLPGQWVERYEIGGMF